MDIFIYFNLRPNHFLGYEHGQPIKKVFSYEAPETGEPRALADKAFQAFSTSPEKVPAAYRDVAKDYRAAELRSLSVGDVLRIGDTWLACAATSWIKLEQTPREVSTTTRSTIDMLIVTPAGEVKDCSLSFTEGEWPTARAVLETLYDQIGCTTVDIVALSPEIDMWVDDEGALKPRVRVNQLASYIATRFGLPFQLYVGTAVFTGGPDAKGATTSLGKPARKSLITLTDELRSVPWRR